MSRTRGEGNGWLQRKKGRWVYRYQITRASDGRTVENTKVIGLISDFPTEPDAWAEVERRHLKPKTLTANEITFGALAEVYIAHELATDRNKIRSKAPTTRDSYLHDIQRYIVPRWGECVALSIHPIEVEDWFESLRETSLKKGRGLAWPTIDKMRYLMSAIFACGQLRCGLPEGDAGNPIKRTRCRTISDYEVIVVTPEQVFAILQELPMLERVLTLLVAATGLRLSEALGLQWQDVDWQNSQINIRRTYKAKHGIDGTKNIQSKAPVPMHPLLAEVLGGWRRESPYAKDSDWLFPSFKLNGEKPRTGNMLAEDHLRPAALKVGVNGVEVSTRRFGFHTLRHSLSTYLVKSKVDPKVVQAMLRHKDFATTIDVYTHTFSDDRIAAQGIMLDAILNAKPNDSKAVN
jgi:integrase